RAHGHGVVAGDARVTDAGRPEVAHLIQSRYMVCRLSHAEKYHAVGLLQRRRSMIEADRVSERRAVHRGVERPPWSPAQLIALLIGIGYIVLGAVALARTGIDLNRIGPHVEVAGLHHTQVVGGIEVLFGLL